MRFKVEFDLKEDEIPKDKNRMILSVFKSVLESYSPEVFHQYYEEGSTKRKDFTFSLNMPECKFNRDTIKIPNKKITLFFSTCSLKTGFLFLNAFIKAKGKKIEYRDIWMTIKNISLIPDIKLDSCSAVFKTSSPIVIREHNKEKNKDWYHDICDEKGFKIFMDNLKTQILEELPESEYDIQDISVNILQNKIVKVKHYAIEIPSNLSTLKINAKPYILKHIYDSGIASLKNAGFGMLTIL